MTNHVYAIERDGLIKIGFTRRRLALRFYEWSLKGGTPIAFKHYPRGEDALIRERELHRIFAPHRQGKTEWFAITKEQLMEHF